VDEGQNIGEKKKMWRKMALKQVPACHALSRAMFSLSLKHAGQSTRDQK
jgi:hypothetical protein